MRVHKFSYGGLLQGKGADNQSIHLIPFAEFQKWRHGLSRHRAHVGDQEEIHSAGVGTSAQPVEHLVEEGVTKTLVGGGVERESDQATLVGSPLLRLRVRRGLWANR